MRMSPATRPVLSVWIALPGTGVAAAAYEEGLGLVMVATVGMQWESWQRQCERSLCTPKVAFEGRAFAHAEPARALLIPPRKWSRPITVAQAHAARPALSLATGRFAHELAVPLDACGAGGAGLLRCGGRRRAAALPLRRRTRPPVEAGRAVALRAHARPRPGARRVRRRSGHHAARARARAGD